MLEKWETPRVTIQEFEPNEYVAACYSVVCNTGAANLVEMGWIVNVNGHVTNNYDAGQTHNPAACGAPGNYYATDDNGDGLIDSLTEYSKDQGPLSCMLYTDSTYKTQAGWGTVNVDSGTIYWKTSSVDGTRTWHHQGTVQVADSSHPNRS